MSARKSRQQPSRPVEDGSDKPDFAADLFRKESPRKQPKRADEEKGKEADTAAHVSDSLDDSVTSKLRAMQADLEKQAASQKAVREGKGPARASGSEPSNQAGRDARDNRSDKDNLSFSELFDPQEPDKASFEDLLKDSKLDWRKFKE